MHSHPHKENEGVESRWGDPTCEQGTKVLGTPLGHPDFVRDKLKHVTDEHHTNIAEEDPCCPRCPMFLVAVVALPRHVAGEHPVWRRQQGAVKDDGISTTFMGGNGPGCPPERQRVRRFCPWQ